MVAVVEFFLAAADQFGRASSFLFHHSKMSIVELTSAVLARYLGNSSLRPAIMSGSIKILISLNCLYQMQLD